MRAQVKRKMNALIAAIMAAIFAFSLSGVPTSALAANESDTSNITISGIDFMQPSAEGWEVLKVGGLNKDQALYITVKKDGKPLSNPMKFVSENETDGIAEIVGVNIIDDNRVKTANQIFGEGVSGTYTIEVNDAFIAQGTPLYEGTIYPVYAIIENEDGTTKEPALLGIRTFANNGSDSRGNIGVSLGQTYYVQPEGQDYPTSYSLDTEAMGGADNKFVGNAYNVIYKQNDEADIAATINYVDEQGRIVMTESIPGVNNGVKTATIMKAFTVQDPDDENKSKAYRVISNLQGKKVDFSTNPSSYCTSYTVQVVSLPNMETYPVEIKYVDQNGNLLWTDNVNAKGDGYSYTIPNTFSMGQWKNVDNPDGVEFYRLNKINGLNGSEVVIDNSTNGTVIELNANTVPTADENGDRTVEAVFNATDVTKEATFTVVEIDGETGKVLGRTRATITPDKFFTYTPESKVVDGKTYVPWSGNTNDITCTWESLSQGIDLVQYVYYVPEGYTPEAAKTFTVRYMNIANQNVVFEKEYTIDPKTVGDLMMTVSTDEAFTQNGVEYARVAGQPAQINLNYYSPRDVYTVQYYDPNDPNVADISTGTIQIDSDNDDIAEDLTVLDGPEAGVEGDGTVIINNDDNPLVNGEGIDTTTERTLADNENPLFSGGAGLNGFVIASFVIGAIALIGLVAYFLLRRRKQANDKQNA